MPKPPLSKARLRAAWIVAVAVDALQIGLQATGPLQVLVDWPLDLLTALAMLWLVGFHWAFLPTFLAEAVPWLDVVPTWTIAVAIATRGRSASPEVAPAPPKIINPEILPPGNP
ncbi:MAG TPA: hypothetical protein VJ600_03195 [Holophagaceae bacterium]|nr:hypothetical protein [Holophagaceae bacterium]